MEREGYLSFRGLVSVPAIRETRAEILKWCAAAGWLQSGSDPDEGIGAPGIAHTEPDPDYMAVYEKVLRGEAFNGLAHDVGLVAVLRLLFEEEPLPYARNIARIIFPQNTLHTTPAHQDYLHIQGTEETYTAEEIYADWTSTRHQFYWQDLTLRYSDDDPGAKAARQAAYGAPQAPPADENIKETTA